VEFKSGVTVDVNEQAKKTNEVLEIRRRTRVVGTFPDGNSALMLVCARLRYGPASLRDRHEVFEYEHQYKRKLCTIQFDNNVN